MTPGTFLVLCTGNSCRSQMAEAFLRRRLGDRMPVASAGTEPAERVHPLAVQVMAEKGFDLRSHRPKDLREFLGKVRVHTVATVCDRAAESCPSTWPGAFRRIHAPFEDPASAAGSPEERLEVFRRVRDALDEQTAAWVRELEALGALG
jgi:arsenate reductase